MAGFRGKTQVYIKSNPIVKEITGSPQDIPYAKFLKKLWEYFRANKLNYVGATL